MHHQYVYKNSKLIYKFKKSSRKLGIIERGLSKSYKKHAYETYWFYITVTDD